MRSSYHFKASKTVMSFICRQVLSNPEKRRVYDQAGEQGIKDGGFGQQCNAMDIFNLFFGGGNPFGFGGMGARHESRRTKDLMFKLNVSLEELYNSSVRRLKMNLIIKVSGAALLKCLLSGCLWRETRSARNVGALVGRPGQLSSATTARVAAFRLLLLLL